MHIVIPDKALEASAQKSNTNNIFMI